MRHSSLHLYALIGLLLISGCASAEPEPEPTIEATPEAAAPAASDAAPGGDPSGTWTGDWGPSERDRNPVTLSLMWDGTMLTGTVNPQETPIQIVNTSYNPETGDIKMEADAEGRGGPVHYVIEGKVAGNMMTGTWNHTNGQGNFSITKN